MTGWLRKTLARFATPVSGEVPPLPAEALAAEIRALKIAMLESRFAEARPRLEALGLSNPDDADVLAYLGACRYLQGDAEGAVGLLQAAVAAAPGHAFAWKFYSACLATRDGDPEALPATLRAIELNPDDTQMRSVAASLYMRAGDFDAAARQLNRALEIKPDAQKPLEQIESLSVLSTWKRSVFEFSPKIAEARRRVVNRLLATHRKNGLDADDLAALLGMLEGAQDTFPTARKIAEASVDLVAGTAGDAEAFATTPALLQQLASIFWIAGDGERMLRLRERAHAMELDSLQTRLGVAQAQLMNGQSWADAWPALTGNYFRLRPDVHVRQVPLWKGEKTGTRKVLVYQEQGVGDAIMALRFLPLLAARGIRYELWVLPALADYAARFPACGQLIRSSTLPDPRDHDCALAVPLFGLIAALRLGVDAINAPPVIVPDATPGRVLRERVAGLPGKRIGLIYGGNPQRRDDWLRSLPLDALRPLARLQGVSWVNLMIDDRPDKAEVLELFAMLDVMPQVSCFADTAAVIDGLDAVIAVDSSVAHVAASLGKPVWVLAPSMLDWRWQMGSATSPWWPTVRLLRSDAPGVWTRAVNTLVSALPAELARLPAKA